MKDSWHLRQVDEEAFEKISGQLKCDPLLSRLLFSRGYETEQDIFTFLNPSVELLHSPFLMPGMYDAVSRIKQAVSSKQKIGIFADSDLDGLTSLTLLYTLFKKIGVEVYYTYPTTERNDYGLSKEVIDLFVEEGTTLLITVDCGVRDIAEIAYAGEKGIDVIVCDHHEQDSKLPECTVVNPKLLSSNYPFKELAGVGVTFKLCQAFLYSYLPVYQKKVYFLSFDNERYTLFASVDGIIGPEEQKVFYYAEELGNFVASNEFLFTYNVDEKKIKKSEFERIEKLENMVLSVVGKEKYHAFLSGFFSKRIDAGLSFPDILIALFKLVTFFISEKMNIFYSEVLPFVAIGTVADVVSVQDENRVLISEGIRRFAANNNSIVNEIKEVCGGEVDSKAISWKVAPLLNSPGRFGKTVLTADFFISDSENRGELLDKIHSLNEYRKSYVNTLFETIITGKGDALPDAEKIVLINDFEVGEGVTGLLASKLAEHWERPVIVLSDPQNGIRKGSVRSKNMNVLSLFEPFSELFNRFGGHSQAFGFSLDETKIDTLYSVVNEVIASVKDSMSSIINVDLECDPGDIDIKLIRHLEQLEPFGVNNVQPVFMSRNVTIEGFKYIGKDKVHGKLLTVKDGYEVVGWNKGKLMEKKMEKGVVDLLYNPEINSFLGKKKIQLSLLDID